MKYQLIIFDFDGTLADSFPLFLRVANELADKYSYRKIREDELETLRGYSAHAVLKHTGVPLWKMPLIARHARKLLTEHIGEVTLFEGVDALLRRLSEQGVILALVTSNSYDNVRLVLGPANTSLIRYYECGVSLFGKQAKFRKVLRRSGVPAARTLCVGDEVRDIEAAHAEGIAFGAVAWGFTTLEALAAHGPEEVFLTAEEIADRAG